MLNELQDAKMATIYQEDSSSISDCWGLAFENK
jgi:hypothetical protein